MRRVLDRGGQALGVVLLAWSGWQATQVLAAASAWSPAAAADALPLYLTTVVVSQGGDPTDPAALEAAHASLGLSARALLYSVLYPASLPALLQPWADLGWAEFLARFRVLALATWWAGLSLAGAGGAGPGRRTLGAGLGAAFAVLGQPLLVTALGLGQANLLVAGLLGGAIGALAWRAEGLAAGLAVLGGAVKLVPALALWPLVAGRRWRALAVALAVGLLVVAWTFVQVSPSVAVQGVWRTIAFQGGIAPGWAAVVHDYPRVLVMLAAGGRHGPAGWFTLALTGVLAASRPRGTVLASATAVGAAWLGADAAGVGVFYATLATPAAVWLLVAPLDRRRPAWTWLLAPLAGAFLALRVAELGSVYAELHMLVAGFVVWGGCVVLLLVEAWPWVRRWGRAAVSLVGLAGLGVALWRAVMLGWIHPLPPPPGVGEIEQNPGRDLGDMDPSKYDDQQMRPPGPGPGGGPPSPPPPRPR